MEVQLFKLLFNGENKYFNHSIAEIPFFLPWEFPIYCKILKDGLVLFNIKVFSK
jgi:hypothetical protein